MENLRKFHKQLLKPLKKQRSHSLPFLVFKELFLTQFKVKQQPALFFFAQQVLVLALSLVVQFVPYLSVQESPMYSLSL